MAVLTIRNLPDEVRDRLRVRAARAGRSMEAEVRAILTETASADEARVAEPFQEFVDRLYNEQKPDNVVDDWIAERRGARHPKAADIKKMADEFGRLARERGGTGPPGFIFHREEAHDRRESES